MMLKPSMTDLATRGESYYAVVVGIAKRARQISDEQLEKKKE
ncbi:MAG: DNA-directed RNA polymerase subunit omega, partial [Oscillospiraceae bacterium]|nr:DNA-directed RNA polymerase subunit omega [Oscillospiraceae bacterium]